MRLENTFHSCTTFFFPLAMFNSLSIGKDKVDSYINCYFGQTHVIEGQWVKRLQNLSWVGKGLRSGPQTLCV